jgi:hypothetical protein
MQYLPNAKGPNSLQRLDGGAASGGCWTLVETGDAEQQRLSRARRESLVSGGGECDRRCGALLASRRLPLEQGEPTERRRGTKSEYGTAEGEPVAPRD